MNELALLLALQVGAGAPGQAPHAADTRPSIVARAPIDPGRDVAFHALVAPDTVYVGEQATYQVAVFLSDDVRYRLRRNPEFVPPELRSILAYDVAPSRAVVHARRVGDKRYEAHVFMRALFPLTAGRYVIPPARLSYSLPLGTSFFSREESHSARSESVVIVALDPPAAGRPSDFSGAVGALAVDARVDTTTGRVGDPLLLTLRVSGTGNIDFLPRPTIAIPWADAVPGAERVRRDSSTTVVRGAKEFDWVLTPSRPGELELPVVRYPYFNPFTERYEIAATDPQRVRIAPGSRVVAGASRRAAEDAPLEIRRAFRGPLPEPLTERGEFWLALLAAPVPAAIAGFMRRPRQRREVTPDRRLAAAVREARGDPRALRHALGDALAARVGVRPAAMSDRVALRRALRRAGVSAPVAAEVELLVRELDQAVFSRERTVPADAAARVERLFRSVDEEAKPSAAGFGHRLGRPASAMLALLCVSALAAGVWALQPARAQAEFAAGVADYARGDFANARARFAASARIAPRAADAWANFGTAGWQAHDTAAASVGWQRALRLEPLADDARERLGLLPGFEGGLLGDVPPVGVDVVALVGGALWLIACVAALVGVRRRGHPARLVAGSAAALALVAAGATAHLRSVATARGLAVVVEGARMRSIPSLGGEEGPAALTGEVGRAERAEGVWTRVRFRDGRAGWLESERLTPLGE